MCTYPTSEARANEPERNSGVSLISCPYVNLPYEISRYIVTKPCDKSGLTGDCWEWKGFSFDGYGRLSYRPFRTHKAHRITYELLRAPIPHGLEIDHLCRNTLCVNPLHLEPVTRRENLRRSHATGQGNGTRTHCRRGHEFTVENTYIWHGKRFCLKCQGIRQRAYELRKFDGAAASQSAAHQSLSNPQVTILHGQSVISDRGRNSLPQWRSKRVRAHGQCAASTTWAGSHTLSAGSCSFQLTPHNSNQCSVCIRRRALAARRRNHA